MGTKKACFLEGKQAYEHKGKLRESAVSSAARLPGSVINAGSSGFVPSGYPEFTFSETSFCTYVKELDYSSNLYAGCAIVKRRFKPRHQVK